MIAQARGLIIAAPSSGSGKTLVTLGLLRSFMRAGGKVISAKVGPDYIDPAFHEKASGRYCRNLDTWAMRPSTLAHIITELSIDGSLIICEGVMGLFDGAQGASANFDGSTASLARVTGWSVLLIVDVGAQAASVAALVRGFVDHDRSVTIAGVLFNRVGSASHEAILRDAMAKALPDIPIVGCLRRLDDLDLPSRHLGLVQALEHKNLPDFLDRAADWVDSHLDIRSLEVLTGLTNMETDIITPVPLPPLGQRIAIAQDAAFSFAYPHVLEGWKNAGANLEFFSPLSDQGPTADSDAIYLPGGYPELYAGILANNDVFRRTMTMARDRGASIFGECGGYMVLGEQLKTEDCVVHRMLGFLPLQTSFSKNELQLGYRKVRTMTRSLLGGKGKTFLGHEFHYATSIVDANAKPLFQVNNAIGKDMGKMGLVSGPVAGSFIHLIDTVS